MKRVQLRSSLASIVAALLLLAVVGCGARPPNYALFSADDLYTQAVEHYEARRWDRAIAMLEHFVAQHLGDVRAPEARMLLGEIHVTRREFATAATHFQRLVLDFPSHARVLEARFKICDSYNRLSPRPSLDQEYTLSALVHCESVVENYPSSGEADTAAAMVAELRLKLARKVYDTGLFYIRRRAFDSAVVYFEQVVREYPRTEVAPAALSQLVETFDRIGYVEDARDARERLLREYPESPEAQALRS